MSKTLFLVVLVGLSAVLVLCGCQSSPVEPEVKTKQIGNINFIVSPPGGGDSTGQTQLIFGGWTGELTSGGTITVGSTVTAAFTVIDQNGNPVASGVDATVSIGNNSGTASLANAGTGTWAASITVGTAGVLIVSLAGNVTNSTSLAIQVAELPPPDDDQGDDDGGCNHHDGNHHYNNGHQCNKGNGHHNDDCDHGNNGNQGNNGNHGNDGNHDNNGNHNCDSNDHGRAPIIQHCR